MTVGLRRHGQAVGIMPCPAVLTVESHGDEAGHVEGRAEGAQHAQDPSHQIQRGTRVVTVLVPALEHLPEDLVLRKEPREGEDAGDGEGGQAHRYERDGHVLPQAAHVAHVLLVVAGHDHGAGSEEEAGLEEGVGEDVEHARAEGSGPHAHEHEAQLGHGGIGQHLLDVVLGQAHGGGHEGRERTEGQHHGQGHRGVHVDEVQPRDHVEAAGHHGGGVDQGGDGRRARHGVGQPDVEGDLRGLAHGAHEEAAADEVEPPGGARGMAVERDGWHVRDLADRTHQRVVVEASEDLEDQEEADHEAEIADAVRDEGLLARDGGGFLVEVEADEQVGAEAHALPAQEHHHDVGAQHQIQHAEHEEIHVGHEAVVAAIVPLLGHVARAEQVDEETGTGHQQGHAAAEHVKLVGPFDLVGGEATHHLGAAHIEPGPQALVDGPALRGQAHELDEVIEGEEERHPHAAQGEGIHNGVVLQLAAAEAIDEEPEERQEGDQPKQGARLGDGADSGVGGGVRKGHVGSHDRRHPFSRLMSSTWTVSRLR